MQEDAGQAAPNNLVFPDELDYWTVDECAECLPNMLSSGAYHALWEMVPEKGRSPMVKNRWDKLSRAHQQALIDAAKEYRAGLDALFQS